MRTRRPMWLAVSLILALALGSACGSKTPAAPASTNVPPDTSGVSTPESSPPGEDKAPFQLSIEKYVSPSGAFSLYPPEGWSVDDSNTDSFFEPDDQKGAIYVQVTNTVAELTDDAFGSLVKAREFNFFNVYKDYQPSEPVYDAAAGTYLADKTLTLDDTSQVVSTIYYRKGSAIYSVDYWAEADVAEAYFEVYKGIVLEMDPAPVAKMPGYFFMYNFTGSGNLFAIDVPIHWQWAHNEEGKTVADSFLSPDGNASVHFVVYKDEIAHDLNSAGEIALAIVNQSHASEAGGVQITGEVRDSDRSASFNWTSPGAGISGLTKFEVRGTNILVLTMQSSDSLADVYNPILNDIAATYRIP